MSELDAELGDDAPPAAIERRHRVLRQDLVAGQLVLDHALSFRSGRRIVTRPETRASSWRSRPASPTSRSSSGSPSRVAAAAAAARNEGVGLCASHRTRRVVAEIGVAQLRVTIEAERPRRRCARRCARGSRSGSTCRAARRSASAHLLERRKRRSRCRPRGASTPVPRSTASSCPRVPQSAYATASAVVAAAEPRRARVDGRRDPLRAGCGAPAAAGGRRAASRAVRAIALTWSASAPQETTPTRLQRSCREGQLLEEEVVVVGVAGGLDVLDLVEQRRGGMPLGDARAPRSSLPRRRRSLRRRSGSRRAEGRDRCVPRWRVSGTRRTSRRAAPAGSPSLRCRARGRASSSRSRSPLSPLAADGHRPARDRSTAPGSVAAPGEHEDALLAALAVGDTLEAPASPGARSAASLLGEQPAGRLEQADSQELGDGVDEARAADPGRLGVADHLNLDAGIRDADALDRAFGGAHAAPDRGAFERRARGRGGRDGPQRRAEYDLAVRADVDEEPDAAGHA